MGVYNYKRLVERKLKISNGDEVYVFDTIKDMIDFLGIDNKKSPNISVYSRCIIDDEYYEKKKSDHRLKSYFKRAKELLGDWKLEREDIFTYIPAVLERFKEYEYGWYLIAGSFNGIWCQGEANTNYRDNRNYYKENHNTIIKQLPKIKDVVFIYGDYREV